jgi:hypothetical protein
LLLAIAPGWDRENEDMMPADGLSFVALAEDYIKLQDV